MCGPWFGEIYEAFIDLSWVVQMRTMVEFARQPEEKHSNAIVLSLIWDGIPIQETRRFVTVKEHDDGGRTKA